MKRDSQVLDDKIAVWEKEIRHLADRIETASEGCCAFVKISGTGKGYQDIAPQLPVEDALHVNSFSNL
jgi:hypothetical protein